jgi:hypothetical protein
MAKLTKKEKEDMLNQAISKVKEIEDLIPTSQRDVEDLSSELTWSLIKLLKKADEFLEVMISEDFEDFREGKLSKEEFIHNVDKFNAATLEKLSDVYED